ncbi:MAG TPA: UDP-N-acetylmuramoylalanyl-D-glutamyl-2,6-diaminopimelate--D-alanyl-D-alanine ligase [Rhizomicrobium sp.]|nr:UDP-N-acetylmuramoylalanyl-D-glutamyl-2,6-diaminopimelate--D-alanyl-D-alanine ligase [Rhizomicrobium sp.]
MTALWTSREMESATLGTATSAFAADGVSIDTRTLKRGDLFVALKGEARDGHGFVPAALDRGAAAALVSYRPADVRGNAPLLVVANTQRGLEDLGGAARKRAEGKVAAITGSAGKTTTKEMLRLALGAIGSTHASLSSYNNHWGVPLSLAQFPRHFRFGVFEIGMNHFGEIRSLVGLVKPHVAIVTTIAPAHLEYFGSVEAIADAKSEIFEGLRPDGTAIVPAENPCTERLIGRAREAGVDRIVTFGQISGANARLLSIAAAQNGMRVESEILGRRHSFAIGATGMHIAHNALAALLAVAALEEDVATAARALAGFSALKGRGARLAVPLSGGAIEIIDESYNANPASMRAALALLAAAEPAAGGRRIAVLGDMLELGPQSATLHADLAPAVEEAKADLVFACGRDMRALFEALPPSRRGSWGETSSEIAPEIVRAVRAGDEVLIKGSLGSRMAVILEALKAGGGAP